MTPRYAVVLDRSGGVTGIPMQATIDSADLAEDEAARLWAQVNRAFEEAGSGSPASSGGRADSFTYRLTVTAEGNRREHAFAEPTAGPHMRRLLEELEPRLTL